VTTAVILQPSYVPWRGYFDLARRADVFVFYDDVQYDKHGWRNRNRIKTAQGTQWLTIPVRAKGNVDEGLLVKDIETAAAPDWAKKHALSLRQSYGKAPCFGEVWPTIDRFWATRTDKLCDLTIPSTIALARLLGLAHTRFVRSSELGIEGGKTDRLVSIVEHVGADHYLSGPSARDYLDEAAFAARGISLEYATYEYPPYEQLYPPYDPQVSVLDLLFMEGPRAGRFIWGEGAPHGT
jgi:hypothetical protein